MWSMLEWAPRASNRWRSSTHSSDSRRTIPRTTAASGHLGTSAASSTSCCRAAQEAPLSFEPPEDPDLGVRVRTGERVGARRGLERRHDDGYATRRLGLDAVEQSRCDLGRVGREAGHRSPIRVLRPPQVDVLVEAWDARGSALLLSMAGRRLF